MLYFLSAIGLTVVPPCIALIIGLLPTPLGWALLSVVTLFCLIGLASIIAVFVFSFKSVKIKEKIAGNSELLAKLKERVTPEGRHKELEKMLHAFFKEAVPTQQSYEKLIDILKREFEGCDSAEELYRMQEFFWGKAEQFCREKAGVLYPPQGDEGQGKAQDAFVDQTIKTLKAKIHPALDKLYEALQSYYGTLNHMKTPSLNGDAAVVTQNPGSHITDQKPEQLLNGFDGGVGGGPSETPKPQLSHKKLDL